MQLPMKAGLAIALLCALWMVVWTLAGWHRDPALFSLFYVVIIIQVGVLIWGLRATARDKGYWAQVGAGTLMSVYAGLALIVFSLLFTGLFFPSYFDEIRNAGTELLKSQGKSEADIAAEMERNAWMYSPIPNALSGFVGTVVTGFAASLIIAIFARKKPA